MPDLPLCDRRTGPDGDRPGRWNSVFDALAPHRRRLVLAVLADGPAPIAEPTLARRVVARERPATTDCEAPGAVTSSLVHVHLPMLADVGLVDYTRAGVDPTDRFDALVRTCPVQSLLDGSVGSPPESVDRGLELLAHDTRRRAIEELAARRRLSLHALAEALVVDRTRCPVTAEDVDEVALELQHVHVPKLVEAGVVTRDGGVLRYAGDAFLDEWWFTRPRR